MTAVLDTGSALLITDVQRDFLPGGSLPVSGSDEIVPVLALVIAAARQRGLPIFACRDWHPPDHCSFVEQGGPWPTHCIAGTPGAEFAHGLGLMSDAIIVSKATRRDAEAYSAFCGTDLAAQLHALHVTRLVVGGLTTDYCVFNTVLDALKAGFEVMLIVDAIRAVNAKPGEGDRAQARMLEAGAVAIRSEDCIR